MKVHYHVYRLNTMYSKLLHDHAFDLAKIDLLSDIFTSLAFVIPIILLTQN